MAIALDRLLAEDREQALKLVPFSRETGARLDRFVELLLDWQKRMNLVAASTLPSLWTRHVADSLQLLDLAPDAKTWIDLGSGAGFPGLAIACALADVPGASIHLIESNQKKSRFLTDAIRHNQVPAVVHAVRIEDFVKNFMVQPDVLTARALAPLHQILTWAYPLSKTGAQGLFMKGQDVGSELTEAAKYWKFEPVLVPSRTSPNSRIVSVRHWEPRPHADPGRRWKRR
jgi:16S rRNA (guanine527-N7)-methyltransferase